MHVKVKTIGSFIEHFGFKEREVDFQGNTVEDLMKFLKGTVGATFEENVLEPDGKVKTFIKVLVNGLGIETLRGLSTELNDGDVVAIFPPVGGGSDFQQRAIETFKRRIFLRFSRIFTASMAILIS